TLLAVGCGSERSADPPGSEGGGGEAAPGVDLTVVFWPRGRDGTALEATLTCDPDGGTHPRPGEACAALAENADALAPLPPDAVCTHIYGGPEEAELAGTLAGDELLATFSRQNGCEIDRWDRLAAALELVRP
ncbi:MAG TPA: SSI family serine proteinase inhibitor, partial [Gaiellaceae bacterium]|nr:SSI family serine proteinase inhibitor [Gaiellaceae bacterium]